MDSQKGDRDATAEEELIDRLKAVERNDWAREFNRLHEDMEEHMKGFPRGGFVVRVEPFGRRPSREREEGSNNSSEMPLGADLHRESRSTTDV